MYTRLICCDNLLNISHQKVFKLDEKTLSLWLWHVYLAHWTLAKHPLASWRHLDDNPTIGRLRCLRNFVLYPLYKPLCIEVIFCTLDISSKELVFFINLSLFHKFKSCFFKDLKVDRIESINIHVIYLQNKFWCRIDKNVHEIDLCLCIAKICTICIYTLTFRIKLQNIRFIMYLWMEIVVLIKDLTSFKLTVY